MIYAALNNSLSQQRRIRICQAICRNDASAIHPFVERKLILHIRDAQQEHQYFCVYCLDEVTPCRSNGPIGRRPVNFWYFRHQNENHCIGHRREIGDQVFVNPKCHGCYEAMGSPTHLVQNCKIRRGRSACYCHHAFTPNICPL